MNLVEKLRHFHAAGFWVTERGVSFGYQRLVVDFAAFPEMETAQADLVLDITHSVQLPGGQGNATGGIREAIPYLARAGAAVGVSGFFAETHPDPSKALSDGPNAWPLQQLEALIHRTLQIAQIAHGN
jgi:2-dehydro-3-deoxyphosphooctonate aldolase (KDO 8-P synthase)